MEEYLEHYYEILINTKDMEKIIEFLPTIQLNKTKIIINKLIEKLKEELKMSIELDDYEYSIHLNKVIDLLKNCIEDKETSKEETVTFSKENIIIFSPNFLKSLKKLGDSKLYEETLTAIKNLTNKQWIESNDKDTVKYRRLHASLSGLSEVKTSKTRLLHMHISGDFWYVIASLKKRREQ